MTYSRKMFSDKILLYKNVFTIDYESCYYYFIIKLNSYIIK